MRKSFMDILPVLKSVDDWKKGKVNINPSFGTVIIPSKKDKKTTIQIKKEAK